MYNTDVEKSKQRIIGIDESKYICCCGCHVISCAKFFSIVSIVLSAVTLLSLFSCYYLSADYFIIQLIGNASWFKPETFNDFIYIAFHYSLASCGIDIILNGQSDQTGHSGQATKQGRPFKPCYTGQYIQDRQAYNKQTDHKVRPAVESRRKGMSGQEDHTDM
uniref:Uncharacterized protein n=1 Tax=Acrobeloides nanus TaxID=290746 RepID=A0A914EED2_9BILA